MSAASNAWDDRPFTSDLTPDLLERMQSGVLRTQYRGVAFWKSPFDIALYLQLFSRAAPRTVVEVGTKYGGSALFFADQMSASGVDGNVITVDIEPRVAYEDPRVEVLTGDARALDETPLPSRLRDAPRPLLFVEDSAHDFETTLAVLRFAAPYLRTGDHLVVEDGIVASMPQRTYRRYEDGPNRAVRAFLSEEHARFEIDSELCDLYGHNVTYNPNGWLRRR